MRPRLIPAVRPWLLTTLVALATAALAPAAPTAGTPEPDAPLLRLVAAAEHELQKGELESAESLYRDALAAGWQLLGALATIDGRFDPARDAFLNAAAAAVDNRTALQSLVLVQLQTRSAPQAIETLTSLIAKNPNDRQLRQLLAQAFVVNGQVEQAVQELEETRAAAPDDLELAFTLASGYLRVKKVDQAARLFDLVLKQRPAAATHVLIGRTYRDFADYERAQAHLEAALRLDPRVRRAHYYLGMVYLTGQGISRLDEAIGEFQSELRLAPRDPLTNMQLGRALVEGRRNEEALPALELASRAEPPRVLAFYYLGRCQLALERPQEAVASLRRALELAPAQGASEAQLGGLHNQLGLALRALGAADEAQRHFEEASRIAAARTESSRETLARYMADVPDPEAGPAAVAPMVEASPLSRLAPAERLALEQRTKAQLARAYLNLGVMQAQARRFARAAEQLERATALDPGFPDAQRALGVACFNAGQFRKSAPALASALAAAPGDLELRRMLATALIETEVYDRAAELLAADPGREQDPALQFAYGLALVRSGRPAEGEAVFSRLLARHGESAELSVMLGQARAQEGDYEAAIETLKRALQLNPSVAEANATLGVIYLKQGRLPEAEQVLRAETAARPADVKSANALATVLDLQGRPEEAVPILQAALKKKPDYADARYLLGRLLLARGEAREAAEHLEAAAHLAPEDAQIHYQLGRAYQALGRPVEAEREFETFRQLKVKSRGTP
jgi:tetratricopeptide (TPR) repeat protein